MRQRGFTLVELLVVVGILAIMAAIVVPLVGSTDEHSMKQVTQISMMAIRNAIMGAPNSAGYYNDIRFVSGYSAPSKAPRTMNDLFSLPDLDPVGQPGVKVQEYNPQTNKGWRGPYLDVPVSRYHVDVAAGFITAYGFEDTVTPENSDPAIFDGWRKPIVVQIPPSYQELENVRVVSAGPNGKIDTVLDKSGADLRAEIVDDDNREKLGQPRLNDDIILFLQPGSNP
jgi:prepilin-type N-terminal cleavage/methylation domain-containing protein